MIRRLLLAALAALCLTAPASAKVAIIDARLLGGADTDNNIEDRIAADALTDIVRGLLHEFAVQQGIPDDSLYVVIPASRVTPYQYRFGRFARATGSSDTLRVDAVIHPNFVKTLVGMQYAGTYRPSAMCRADTLPYVPQLCLINTGAGLTSALISMSFVTSAACSIGIKNVASDGIIGSGEAPSGTHEGERSQYQIGYPEIWFNTDYAGFAVRNGTDPAGGLSVLIGTAGNANFFNTEVYGVLANPDSCGRSATGDSMSVWTRRNSHASGAKEMVFAIGSSPTYGLQSGGEEQNIYDATYASTLNIFFGLAHLDSITGGAVFGKGTINVALAVTHLLATNNRRIPGGLCLDDSTAFYASLDSLAALNTKLTFAANSDSASSFSTYRIANQAMAIPLAKFCPMILTGIGDTTHVGGALSETRRAFFSNPIDPFGRYRRRGLAYGPWPPTDAVGDSSVSTLVRGALDLTRSTFGAGRTSSVLWPANDDWSPINYEQSDSVLIAARLAGATGIVFDPRNRSVTSAFPGANPRGWYNEARTMFPGGAKLIPRIGGNTMANAWFPVAAVGDSAFPPDSLALAQSLPLWISQRAWTSILGPRYDRAFVPPLEVTDNGHLDGVGYWGNGGRGRILAVSAQELAGGATKSYALQPAGPYRNGWWGIKHFVHAARVANRLAGRPLINFCWLDEL